MLLVVVHTVCHRQIVINELALPELVTVHTVGIICAGCQKGLNAAATG